jgi:hypothetical protein
VPFWSNVDATSPGPDPVVHCHPVTLYEAAGGVYHLMRAIWLVLEA